MLFALRLSIVVSGVLTQNVLCHFLQSANKVAPSDLFIFVKAAVNGLLASHDSLVAAGGIPIAANVPIDIACTTASTKPIIGRAVPRFPGDSFAATAVGVV